MSYVMRSREKAEASPLAGQIRETRVRLGMRREDFAVRLGVSLRQVVRWETGKSRPTFGALQRIRKLSGDGAVPPVGVLLPAPGSRKDLHAMLDIILERAPRAMIDAVADYLFEHAGRYGWAKEPAPARKERVQR